MDSIFLWLVGGVAGLLLTAAVVAGWEHLRRSVRPQEEFTSATPKVVSIDLRLDRLSAQPAAATPVIGPAPPASDQAQRRAAVEDVLARMSQPPGLEEIDNPRHWAETTPMVAPGQLEPHEPAAARRPREFSASQQP